jgi:flagellar basal body rod protein FlgG
MPMLPRFAAVLALMALLGGCPNPAASGDAKVVKPFCLVPPPILTMPATTRQQTGRIFDVTIDGPGFFVLRDPVAGKNYYSRVGQFRTTPEGTVISTDGRLVIEPSLTISTDAVGVQITADGFLKVRQPIGEGKPDLGWQPVGQFQLAQFSIPERLEASGPNLFTESCASGDLTVGSPGQQGLGKLLPGVLEMPVTASAAPSTR